jgi:hypothetical protein
VKRSGRSRRVLLAAGSESLLTSAGATLLAETARAAGLDRSLTEALAPWRAPRAAHDPGKVVLDLAVAIALGGDCLADLAVVRAQPAAGADLTQLTEWIPVGEERAQRIR